MTWLTRIALKKPWITYLITAIVTGVSIWASITLKTELIPDISLPMTTIVTVYPQAQPDEVMNTVTIPVENAIADMKGIKHITSTSSENTSVVFAEFEYGTNMEKTNQLIADNLSKIDFPDGVDNALALMPQLKENPRIIPVNINAMPTVVLNLAGDKPVAELAQIAETQLLPSLKEVTGVYEVSVSGGDGDKVIVTLSLEKMQQLGLSTAQVSAVLLTNQFNSLGDVQQIMLSPAGPRLDEIADVVYGPPPGTTINRANGKPCVRISISKEAAANAVTTANEIISKADELKSTLPEGVELYTVLDQSTYIENSINDLATNAYLGGGLAIVIVFLFLMAFGASLVTAVSIPLSVLFAFMLMRITNLTVNLLTLSAMIVAIGQVIDNSIVVLEVAYRKMQDGEKFFDAAVNGVREVIVPITSTTLATVIIFIPLIWVGGIIGEMFVPFALTITYAMLGSLLIAVTIVPALAKFLVIKRTNQLKTKPAPKYERVYTTWLKWCLSHRVLTIIIATVMFSGSIGLIPVIGTSFMPELNINVVTIDIRVPEGFSQDDLVRVTLQAEDLIKNNPKIQNYSTSIGSSRSRSGGYLSGSSSSISTGVVSQITAILVPKTKSVETSKEIYQELVALNTGAIFKVGTVQATASDSTSKIDISVRGMDMQSISYAATYLSTRLKTIDGVGDQEIKIVNEHEKLIIEPDYTKLATAGFTSTQIEWLQKEIYILLQGGTVTTANIHEIPTEITFLPLVDQAKTVEGVANIRVGVPTSVALGSVANVQIGNQVDSISRTDRKIAATISVNVTQNNIGAVNRDIQDEIDAMEKPVGVEISLGGVSEDMSDSFSSLLRSILIAIVLVYFMLVITYRSFLNPLIIMMSLPLASIGAFLGLLITGHTLGVTGMMGMLQLVGIVLANAVLLIAYVEQLRKQGSNIHEALITGGQTRLRPILMTALTTLIAILPMAFGLGDGVIIAADMAIVVVGGLFSSTLLTLLVVPVIYSLVYDRGNKRVT